MTKVWNDLEGVSFAGRYVLEERLTAGDGDAWYRTRLPGGASAAVRVAPDSRERLSLWRDAIALQHPHLVRMLDAGRIEVDGEPLIFAVCEFPDDFLAGVLHERPLSPAEAREVLRVSVDALRVLHARGTVHAGVAPAHIMAFGEHIKLPSDTWERPARNATPRTGPYDAPETAAGRLTPAADLWSLGITLHESLTQQRPNLERDPEFRYMAEPFATVLRNCLVADPEARWTVDAVARFLDPPAQSPAPAPVPEPPVAAVPAATPAPTPAATKPTAPAPPKPAAPKPAAPKPAEPLASRRVPFRWVPLAGIVSAGLLGLLFLRNPEQPVAAPAAPPAAAAARSAPAPAAKTTHPAARKPSPMPDRTSAAPDSARWRVVAYTYNTKDAADKKVASIEIRHPELNPEVFALAGSRGPYFVSLGGRMAHEEALRMRERALSKGMPRDTFVRNFTK